MEKDRNTLVLYSSSICNLKCKYCYIDKNPALLKIDKLLEESFKGDYYFNFTKKMFPDPFQLKEIQFWGGEPSIGLCRTKYTVNKIIENYPCLDKFMMSTNLTLDNFCEIFFDFLELLENYPDRNFEFNLQLSIDGPKYINDKNRGKGVTEKFFKNYRKLLENIEKVPKNVKIRAHFKPTLDNNSIWSLQTKDKVIEYYQFLDKLSQMAHSVECNSFTFFECVPNTASPSPHTKKDGQKFANLCKLCNEIHEDGVEKYFVHYKNIMPFGKRNIKNNKKDNIYRNCGNCGTGSKVIGLLPNNMISACHNGFVDLISDYKLNCINNNSDDTVLDKSFFGFDGGRLTLSIEEFKKFEVWMTFYFQDDLKVKNANLSSLINTMARLGQIDEKYVDFNKCAEAANFINHTFAYCIRDNINSTGCMELPPLGEIRLLLNGAMEEMQKNGLSK